MSYSKNSLRPAFTIIEILISVIIISFSIIYVLKIHSSTRNQIVYISERNKLAFEDSLYLTDKVLKYNKDKKSAYSLIEDDIRVKKLDSREILKKSKRDINIPEEIDIKPPMNMHGPTAIINEIMLKGEHSAIFWHFHLKDF